jgi:hypothetical protein
MGRLRLSTWHWLIHVAGIDEGQPFGHWDWYNFFSGIGGSFLVNAVIWFFAFYAHRTCHTWWCPRAGRYPFTDEATGLEYKLCRVCHPTHSGERLTRRRIAHIHAANKSPEGTA